MEWSNEKTIQFIKLYEAHPLIWDTTLEGHKDRNRVHEAWKEIANEMGEICRVIDLKKKKDSLMASFRFYKKKIRESKHTGSGAGDVYKPTWFAYPILNRFLGKKNIPVSTLNTDVSSINLYLEGKKLDFMWNMSAATS